MLVKFLRRFEVADFDSDGNIRLNTDEKYRRGDSFYIRFEDFCHIFNFGGYKPAIKINGNRLPIDKLLELKDIRQLDLNEHHMASSDEAAKLIAQNSATLKHLTNVPKAFFKRLPPLQLEYLSINGKASTKNVNIPNVKVQCFEYPHPSRGYSSAFFIKRIDAEEILVSGRRLETFDERPFAVNSTVKRFRIRFDRVQNFDPSRLLQDLHAAYPSLEQLVFEDGLDRNDTAFVRQLCSDSHLNGMLSSLQEVAGKTTFKISYAGFKRFRLIDDASVPSTDDVFAGFKLVREKKPASRFNPRRSRLYEKRGSVTIE
ncbi:hypothetical protein AAVH_12203 [Aphelenchoides avenae]|nr:hypothetical protein AAVH_12203 [Aphelenchus avenae]